MPDDTFAALLKARREAAGLSVAVLAARAALSPAAVYALESGTRTAPAWPTVIALADALGVSTDDLRPR